MAAADHAGPHGRARAASRSLDTKPEAPAARAAAGDIRPAPGDQQHAGARGRTRGSIRRRRRRTRRRGTGRRARRAARRSASSSSASAPLRAARQRSTHDCSPSSIRRPQWTTSWSSTTSTRSFAATADGPTRALTPPPSGPRGTTAEPATARARSGPNSTTPPISRASNAARRSPIPAPRTPSGTPSLRTSSTNVSASPPTSTVISRRRGVLGHVAQRLGEHRLGQRLERRRDVGLAAGHDADRDPGLAAEPFELLGERRHRVPRQRSERPLERAAQLADRLLGLRAAALALLAAQVLGRAERERDPEHPLEHALVDLAGELEPLGQVRLRSCWRVA